MFRVPTRGLCPLGTRGEPEGLGLSEPFRGWAGGMYQDLCNQALVSLNHLSQQHAPRDRRPLAVCSERSKESYLGLEEMLCSDMTGRCESEHLHGPAGLSTRRFAGRSVEVSFDRHLKISLLRGLSRFSYVDTEVIMASGGTGGGG